jgi:hypothetical protein
MKGGHSIPGIQCEIYREIPLANVLISLLSDIPAIHNTLTLTISLAAPPF